jgi:branched-subunit amino acid aminotransferase/4-amino-4-deoxychorismate lyase
VSIDGKAVGDGKPGPVTRRIHELYRRMAEQRAKALR